MKRTRALLHILEIWLAMMPFVLVGVHPVLETGAVAGGNRVHDEFAGVCD